MEALFSTTLASYEAWIMLLCVIVFLGIYLFDGISFVQRVYAVLKPHTPQRGIAPLTPDESVLEVTSPILEPIAIEEVEAHDREKLKAEEKHEQEVIQSEIFEEKVLEEIQSAEQVEEVQEIQEVSEIIEENNQTEKNTLDNTQSSLTPTEEGENNLEEEEKAEEELLDIKEKIENTEEIQEISEKVEENNEIEEKSVTPSEIPDELSDVTEEQGEKMIEDTVGEQGEVTSENTMNATEATPSSEEVRALPITASIPEPKSEFRRPAESQNTEKLYTIVSEIKTLLARGQSQDARALIIEGLSLDKNHRELNLILGSIYESERQAQKAEYIYKDLALVYPEDGEILEKLANILIIEKRYELAMEIYKKIISLSGETEGSLYIMTHLAHELGHNEELYAYARRYQKNWPNNPDILTLLAHSEITLGERQSAIQTLIKLKNLTPYNNEIMETIAKLTMEEELAGNFGG